MENQIILNLLEQIKKLTDENCELKMENFRLKENMMQAPVIVQPPREVIVQAPVEVNHTHYDCLENLVMEKYKNSMSIKDFEDFLKTTVTENDVFDCINKNVHDVITNVLIRELSNKDIRPIHKNKYYLVKNNNEWVKKEYFDYDLVIKRFNNIVSYGLVMIFNKIKNSKDCNQSGSNFHKYKNYTFDINEMTINLMNELNHKSISKKISNIIHVNL